MENVKKNPHCQNCCVELHIIFFLDSKSKTQMLVGPQYQHQLLVTKTLLKRKKMCQKT